MEPSSVKGLVLALEVGTLSPIANLLCQGFSDLPRRVIALFQQLGPTVFLSGTFQPLTFFSPAFLPSCFFSTSGIFHCLHCFCSLLLSCWLLLSLFPLSVIIGVFALLLLLALPLAFTPASAITFAITALLLLPLVQLAARVRPILATSPALLLLLPSQLILFSCYNLSSSMNDRNQK